MPPGDRTGVVPAVGAAAAAATVASATARPNPPGAVPYSCPPELLVRVYDAWLGWSRRAGVPLGAYLFWGAEYWLLRARGGDSSYLRAFARVLEEPSTLHA